MKGAFSAKGTRWKLQTAAKYTCLRLSSTCSSLAIPCPYSESPFNLQKYIKDSLPSSRLRWSFQFILYFFLIQISLTTDNPIWVKFVTLVGNLSFKLWAVEGLILKKTQFNIQRKTFCVLSESDDKIQTQNNIMMNTVSLCFPSCTLELVY